jgi:hypothetical protein
MPNTTKEVAESVRKILLSRRGGQLVPLDGGITDNK